MSLMVDVTADQPPLPGRLAVQDLASEEVASFAEELAANVGDGNPEPCWRSRSRYRR